MRVASALVTSSSSRALRVSATQQRRQVTSALAASRRHPTAASKASLGFPRLRSLSTASASSVADAATTSESTTATTRTTTRPPRPELPEPQFVEVDGKCVLKYVEFAPESGAMTKDTPTIVLIHGAPGSYKDFRYLMPLLSKHNARVIGVNLPGFDGSDVLDADNYYHHISAVPSVQSTLEGIAKICGPDENVFVLGHSFGGHAAMHFAGLNAEQQLVNLRGMFLLASAGFKPHRALIPSANEVMFQLLRSNVSILERAGKELVHWVYTKHLGFPDNGPKEYFAAGIVRCATADFTLFREHLERTSTDLPSFLAWAQDDAFMEEAIFHDVSAACHPGPRFEFQRGGHNVQKTKADFLAVEMTKWMESVVAGTHEKHAKDVTVLP
ncbi:Serine protease family s33 [Globisporangium polare]